MVDPVFEAAWEEKLPLLENGVTVLHGTHEVEDIKAGVLAGHYHCWFGINSIIITEFIQYPRKKSINFFLASGKPDEIIEMKNQIEVWAKLNGCDFAQGTGRLGWLKYLKDYHGNYGFRIKDL